MKLTKQAKIAIHILALCARPPTDTPVTTRMAAGFADTTKDHAAHVVARLVRHGYLQSERGRSGGINLAVAPSRINVGDVLRLIEPCFSDGANPIGMKPANPFDAVVRAAVDSYVAIFDSFTIADLVANPDSGRIRGLKCDLHTLVRRGKALSRLRRHPSFGKPAVPKLAVHAG